jgi:NADH-quinone oxidoreductase subunit N
MVAAIPSLLPAVPEIMLALGALGLLMVGAFGGARKATFINGAAMALLAMAAILVVTGEPGRIETFGGAFVLDDYARFLKVLTFAASAVALAMAGEYFNTGPNPRFEYPVLVLLAACGMGMVISANDLIALYLGMELMSLALYVVAAIDRDSLRSTEAGLKYFVLGALSSGMLLYGASLVYGFAGTVSFAGIAQVTGAAAGPGAGLSASNIGVIVGLVFVFAGLCFKVSAVPFHMWTPDVYEGAPTPVTAFFAAAPKAAGMAVFVRVALDAFPDIAPAWQQIVVFVAIASMTLGAFAAIGQSNIKRLMAYSSISHMGFALTGLAAGTADGVSGVLIYMSIYVVMTLGSFACILAMRRPEGPVEQISDLAGLARTEPLMALLFGTLLFSLAGVPWFAGFFAKFYVFLAAIEAKLYLLAVIGVLASVVGAYYYLRIVKIMCFDEPKGAFVPMSGELKAVLGAAGLFVSFYIVYPSGLNNAAAAAAKSLF